MRTVTTDAELEEFFTFRWEGDPYELYGRLRDSAPLHTVKEQLVVCRHDDVREVYRDASRFASGFQGRASERAKRILDSLEPQTREHLEQIFEFERPTPVRSNGELHARLRSAVQRTFTPKRVSAMRDRVQAITDELLVDVPRDEPIDLIDAFAYRLPLAVIIEIMGVPTEDTERIHDWAMAIGANRGGVVAELIEPAFHAFVEFKAYLDEQIVALESNPSENLLSILLDREQAGRLTRDELTSNVINLLFAGHETTTNLIGNGTLSLLSQRDQWERLTDDPDLAPQAVEELLRFESPVQFTGRIAIDDTEVGEQPIAAGTNLITLIASSNRDPDRFVDPDRIDITREDCDHLAFGFGPHYCLGTFLARIEGDIAFRTLASGFSEMVFAGDEPEWRANRNLRGLVRLPVVLEP